MENFNDYLNAIDFTEVIGFVKETGKETKLKKKEYFGLQDTPAQYIGYIVSGAVRYICVDDSGKEHIVGYSFQNDFACDYPSFIHKAPRLVNIQAVMDTTMYVISFSEYNRFFEEHGEHFARRMAEEYSTVMYKRLLDLYCKTPEQRYVDLLTNYPNLMKLITLKEVASYIGVTPETLSHIRRRFQQDEKMNKLLR